MIRSSALYSSTIYELDTIKINNNLQQNLTQIKIPEETRLSESFLLIIHEDQRL